MTQNGVVPSVEVRGVGVGLSAVLEACSARLEARILTP